MLGVNNNIEPFHDVAFHMDSQVPLLMLMANVTLSHIKEIKCGHLQTAQLAKGKSGVQSTAWVQFLPSPKHEACLIFTIVVQK